MCLPFVNCTIFIHITRTLHRTVQCENIWHTIDLIGGLKVLMSDWLAGVDAFAGNGDGMAGGMVSHLDCGNRPEESKNGVLLVIARCRAAPSSWMILRASESDLGGSGND